MNGLKLMGRMVMGEWRGGGCCWSGETGVRKIIFEFEGNNYNTFLWC